MQTTNPMLSLFLENLNHLFGNSSDPDIKDILEDVNPVNLEGKN